MSDMTVTGSGVLSPSRTRKKPKLALRGRRRKGVKKLLAALRVVTGQDETEATRAEQMAYVPYLFRQSGSGITANAMARMIGRCNDVLKATL